MINLNNLRIFYMVAKYQSVTLAAQHLYISQPAVSNALKKIQKETHSNLFTKVGRQLLLSEQGKELFLLTEQLFAKEIEIELCIQAWHSKRIQTINLGIVTLYERFGMLDILSSFSKDDEEITLSVQSGNSEGLIQLLKEKQIDMAITGVPEHVSLSDLTKILYHTHNVMLVIPKGHRLFGVKNFYADDIKNERLLLKEQGSSVRATVERYFQANNITPNIFAELSNLDSLVRIAQHEKCLTFIPDMAINDMLNDKKNFSVALASDSHISFSIYVLTRKQDSFPIQTWDKIQPFLDTIKSRAQETFKH